MKNLLISVIFVLVLTIALGACSQTTPASTSTATSTVTSTATSTSTATTTSTATSTSTVQPPKPITVKLGYDTPPPTGLGVPAEFFAKEVTARTNGRVTVQTYPAATLSTQASSLESLRAGVADAYVLSLNSYQDAFPVLQFTGMPGLDFFPDTDQQMKDEVNTMLDIIDKYPAAAEELAGLHFLYSCTYTSNILMGKGDPILVPADMNGKKIGASGLLQDVIIASGGTPVAMIPPEMYQNIQTGVVTDTLVAWGAALDWQLQELVKYVLDMSFGGGQLPTVMNENTWNKISPQDQQIVTAVAAEAEQVNRDFVTKQIPEARQKWTDAGIPIIKPTADQKAQWIEKFSAIWDKYIATNKADGVTDIDAIFNEWKTAAEASQAANAP
jgi:TRAP-type C4-dicarboxylate transport system substrate-binding protein